MMSLFRVKLCGLCLSASRDVDNILAAGQAVIIEGDGITSSCCIGLFGSLVHHTHRTGKDEVHSGGGVKAIADSDRT